VLSGLRALEAASLAKDYQERAVKVDHGTLPDIGNAPYSRVGVQDTFPKI